MAQSAHKQALSDQYFKAALNAFRAENLIEAMDHCQAALRHTPHHRDSLRMLGSIEMRRGRHGVAITYLQKALRIKEDPDTYNALAVAYKNNSEFPRAEQSYRRCLKQFPSYAEAYINLALMLQSQARDLEALDIYTRALIIQPQEKKILINICVLYHRMGKSAAAINALDSLLNLSNNIANDLENIGAYLFQQRAAPLALKCFELLINSNPEKVGIFSQLGAGILQQGDINTAILVLEKALSYTPNDIYALNNLGLAYSELKDESKAIELLKKAVTIDPSFADGLSNLACFVGKTDDKKAAEDYARRALAIRPDHVDALINLGKALTEQDNTSAAEQVLLKAHRLAPTNAAVLSNLGNVCNRTGRFDEAIDYYKKNLELAAKSNVGDRQTAESFFNLGVAYEGKGETNTAIDIYKKSAVLNQENKDCMLNLGINELVAGDFKNAWGHYFYRPRVIPHGIALSTISPGLNLSGKKILLVPGQGLGDEILFLRFCTLAKKQGASISYLADTKLEGVLKTSSLFVEVSSKIKNVSKYDYIFASDDLPLIFNINSADLIGPPLQLAAESTRTEKAIKSLQEIGEPPYIGITWRAGVNKYFGGTDYKTLRKDISINSTIDILNNIKCTVVNMQRNPRDEENRLLVNISNNPVAQLHTYNNDLEDMLALVGILDDYIAVSNTNVHLRAAVGLPTRVLIPFPPEWRWLTQGKHSPWYPDITTYRQAANGHWDIALTELASDLNAMYTQTAAAP